MNEPLASAAGNALEIRNAVDFLTGAHRDPRLLRGDAGALRGRARAHRLRAATPSKACEVALWSGRATEHFAEMVALLGGPADFVERMDKYLAPAPIVVDVTAEQAGVISEIDTRGVGMAVVALGGGRRMPTDTIDHTVGFDRLLGLGARVEAGTPLARLHARDAATAADASRRLHRRLQARRRGADPSADRRSHRSTGGDLMARVILCILDSFGIGGAPDAAAYSDGHGHPDAGADTLGHIAANYDLHVPNLDAMGLGAAGKLSTGHLARGLSAEPKGGR